MAAPSARDAACHSSTILRKKSMTADPESAWASGCCRELLKRKSCPFYGQETGVFEGIVAPEQLKAMSYQ
jgi:hypothetical protein